MLTLNELYKRLELVIEQRKKIKAESVRLRVKEHRYRKLIKAYEDMEDFCDED